MLMSLTDEQVASILLTFRKRADRYRQGLEQVADSPFSKYKRIQSGAIISTLEWAIREIDLEVAHPSGPTTAGTSISGGNSVCRSAFSRSASRPGAGPNCSVMR